MPFIKPVVTVLALQWFAIMAELPVSQVMPDYVLALVMYAHRYKALLAKYVDHCRRETTSFIERHQLIGCARSKLYFNLLGANGNRLGGCDASRSCEYCKKMIHVEDDKRLTRISHQDFGFRCISSVSGCASGLKSIAQLWFEGLIRLERIRMPVHPKGETQGRVSSTCVRRDATDVHGTK